VTVRQAAAASCGERSLVASMDHYNMRVNITLWLEKRGCVWAARGDFCLLKVLDMDDAQRFHVICR
jgi:hypothetical protein